jgi:hypothetical protein
MFKYILNFLLICGFVQAQAQDNLVSISADYNIPLGKMNWSYKPAVGAQISYTRVKVSNRRWESGVGVTIGYTQFNPIADTLYYVVDRGGVQGVGLGTAVYSPFKIFSVSAAMIANRTLSEKLALSMNLAIGYYYGKRDIEFKDEFGAADGVSELIGRGAAVPKIGLKFSLNDNVSITPFISYTFMIELGSTNPDAINYNPGTGASLNFYSTGLALNFIF